MCILCLLPDVAKEVSFFFTRHTTKLLICLFLSYKYLVIDPAKEMANSVCFPSCVCLFVFCVFLSVLSVCLVCLCLSLCMFVCVYCFKHFSGVDLLKVYLQCAKTLLRFFCVLQHTYMHVYVCVCIYVCVCRLASEP